MKILLLEDDLNLCSSIQEALQRNRYIVDSCNDGETAMLYALNTEVFSGIRPSVRIIFL